MPPSNGKEQVKGSVHAHKISTIQHINLVKDKLQTYFPIAADHAASVPQRRFL